MAILEPVTLDGPLRCPGLFRDDRGIVLGREALLRFTGAEALLSFLRLASARGELQGLLPRLEALHLASDRLGGNVALRFAAPNSRDLEGLQEPLRLAGGQLFVGDGPLFVPFRNEEAPFGYDAPDAQPPAEGLELLLPTQRLDYRRPRKLDLAALVFSMPLLRHTASEAATSPALLLAPAGIGPAVGDYLARRAPNCGLALLERPGPEWGGGARQYHAFSVQELDPVGWRLLRSVPGLSAYQWFGERLLVPCGWRHPLPLQAFSGLVAPDELLLLQASEAPWRVPSLQFLPLAPRVRLKGASAPIECRTLEAPRQRFSVQVRLTPGGGLAPTRGALIPASQFDALRRLLQRLPETALQDCTLAVGTELLALLGPPEALRLLPLGVLLRSLTEKIYLPVGMRLTPEPSLHMLSKMFSGAQPEDVILLNPSGEAYRIPREGWTPLSRVTVARFYARRVELASRLLEERPGWLLYTPASEPGA